MGKQWVFRNLLRTPCIFCGKVDDYMTTDAGGPGHTPEHEHAIIVLNDPPGIFRDFEAVEYMSGLIPEGTMLYFADENVSRQEGRLING